MVQGNVVDAWPAVLMALAVLAVPAAAPAAPPGPLGEFDAHADVGSPRRPGSATYNAASQEYGLAAAGVNMWGGRDEFHFAWKRLTGDFILQARVEFLGKGVDPHRKAGWIVRTSLDEDSPHAAAVVHGDGLTSLQYRKTKGAPTEQVQSTASGADVIQLERKGIGFTFSAARHGEPFSESRLPELGLGDAVYVGLFLCSHNPDVLESAVFRNVRMVRPAPAGFVPYRDYIGSHLEVLDLATGHRQVVLSSAEPFEAPNWTPDGKALVYNTSGRAEGRGRLHRFDLATRQATPIDTGSANRNNNDHVLSFDGTLMGISDQSSPGGQSTIFTLPAAGGTPRRITPLVPSYLHGWSPDGRFLVYTGGRNGEYDIYRIPADGSGPEVRLTDYKGLDDGPEYSPDGRFIYFNSTRSGTMQIWRMKPDGREPEAVTSDGLNNWFPHLSPDGRWIAFLSYGADVDPADHPYYRHVSIRVMPAEGGPARVVAYVYGGQGTINVPSWSPDGNMLAFVSNSALDGLPRVLEVSSVAPGKDARLSSLIAEIRAQADAFVFLSGGASKMSDDHQRRLLAMFEALTLVSRGGRRIAVGDGGTQAGIMEAAGHARRASGNAFPLIGVPPAREVPPRGKTPLDPNHSHIVAVDDPDAPAQDSWGSETATMYWLFGELAEGRPSVTIVANGGGITLKEVEANVRAGRPMILVEGSGRAADALVSLLKKTQATDPDAVVLKERAEKAGLAQPPELFRVVPLEAGAAGLRDAIIAVIGAK